MFFLPDKPINVVTICVCGCTGKFGAVFASIPAPIVAALYCLFFAYVGMYDQLKNLVFLHTFIKSLLLLSSKLFPAAQVLQASVSFSFAI